MDRAKRAKRMWELPAVMVKGYYSVKAKSLQKFLKSDWQKLYLKKWTDLTRGI